MWNFSFLFLLFLSATIFTSCNNDKTKIGKYVYLSSEQKSEIHIFNDGSFYQVIEYFKSGEKIENNGNWNQKNSAILFYSFLRSVADEKNSVLIPPKKYSSFPAVLRGSVIVFDEQSEYWFHHEP